MPLRLCLAALLLLPLRAAGPGAGYMLQLYRSLARGGPGPEVAALRLSDAVLSLAAKGEVPERCLGCPGRCAGGLISCPSGAGQGQAGLPPRLVPAPVPCPAAAPPAWLARRVWGAPLICPCPCLLQAPSRLGTAGLSPST